jgi:hypothetical protein
LPEHIKESWRIIYLVTGFIHHGLTALELLGLSRAGIDQKIGEGPGIVGILNIPKGGHNLKRNLRLECGGQVFRECGYLHLIT